MRHRRAQKRLIVFNARLALRSSRPSQKCVLDGVLRFAEVAQHAIRMPYEYGANALEALGEFICRHIYRTTRVFVV